MHMHMHMHVYVYVQTHIHTSTEEHMCTHMLCDADIAYDRRHLLRLTFPWNEKTAK